MPVSGALAVAPPTHCVGSGMKPGNGVIIIPETAMSSIRQPEAVQHEPVHRRPQSR